MTVNEKHKRHAFVTPLRPGILLRSALFTGSAVAALTLSAAASYGVVSLLFPHSGGTAASGHAALPTAAWVAPMSTPIETAPAITLAALEPPTAALPTVAPARVPDPASVPVAAAPVAPTPTTYAATHMIPASFSAAAPAVVATQPAAAETPVPTESFASLAARDAGARAGAGLFPGAVARPDPTPEPAVLAVAPAIRPAPRPQDRDAAVLTLAVATVPAAVAPTASIRPAPRPDIVLASMTAPAAPIATAPPALATRTGLKSGSGGLFSGGSSSCGTSLARAMPARRGGATGSQFFAGLTGVSGSDRDARVIAELARGNMPGFLHDLQPVGFKGRDARGQPVEITICVTPDYLALGSDSDYVRTPLGLPAAGQIAGAFDMTLPTPRMVDAIYAQADVRLAPSPMTPGPQMSSTGYFVTHNATIQKQLQGRGGLIAGQKKDLVMASRLASHPGKVAIYGWHQPGGHPIQPVSTVHQASYADYSHGIRLVSKTAFLNGKAVSLDELLESGRYANLLNDDGPMPGQAIRVASR